MKASTKSLHAKLYNFTYASFLPQNLCPYFWKLVWAIIIFIPNAIIQLPSRIGEMFSKHPHKGCKQHRSDGWFYYSVAAIILIYFDGTFQMIKAAFRCYSYDYQMANVGIVLNSIILFLVIFIIALIVDDRREERKKKAKKPSIVGEFIRAKYNKICPKIDWE